MKIKLWGVRGSCPRPVSKKEYTKKINKTVQLVSDSVKENPNQSLKKILSSLPKSYSEIVGGNTTCIEIEHEGVRLIIDLGTGVRELGEKIAREDAQKNKKAEKKETKELHILMTHTHWDHIQGWPFFQQAYSPDYKINFYSSIKNLEKRLIRQQNTEHFPISLKQMMSNKKFHYFKPGASFSIGPFQINAKSLLHPGKCTSYKISVNKKSFIFATDIEIYPLSIKEEIKRYKDYFQDADLLVMDGQFSIMDAMDRKGWGHTAMITTIDCALHWQVKHLVVTHHDPSYDDQLVWKIFAQGKKYLEKKENNFQKLQVDLAQEGKIYYLTD